MMNKCHLYSILHVVTYVFAVLFGSYIVASDKKYILQEVFSALLIFSSWAPYGAPQSALIIKGKLNK